MTDLPDFETVRRELETELEQEGLDTSARPAVPVVGYEDVELLDTYSPELKGSIGEGPNHSNHSNHSNSFKIQEFSLENSKISEI